MQYLHYGDTTVNIDGTNITLPSDYILSLEKRGKRNKNFVYNSKEKSLSIYCNVHQLHHPVYTLQDDGQWLDVSGKTYRKSIERNTGRSYFGSNCHQNMTHEETVNEKPLKTSLGNEKVKTTFFLSDQNADYINYRSVFLGINKVDLINQIIAQERERNPLKHYLPNSLIDHIKNS